MTFFQIALVVFAAVLAVLYQTGAGAFLLKSMQAMAEGYNDQYKLDEDGEEDEKDE